MIDLVSFKMPIFKKMEESLMINNYRKNPIPDNLEETKEVINKSSIIWRKSPLF